MNTPSSFPFAERAKVEVRACKKLSRARFAAARRLVALLSFQLVLTAVAQTPGSVDTNFPAGSGASGRVNSVLLQQDGKVLVSGVFSNMNSVLRRGIARLNPDGSLDANFPNNLTVVSNGTAGAMVLQPDGKVILTGNLVTNHQTMARLNSDGSLDASFHDITIDFGLGGIRKMALQPSDGKLFIVGSFFR